VTKSHATDEREENAHSSSVTTLALKRLARHLPPITAPQQNGARQLPRFEGYEVLGELGRGGMGIVYKARQTSLNRLVALKVVLGGTLADGELLARFKREAEAVARFQHPAIVQIFEIGIREGLSGDGLHCPYIALEFVEGGTLSKRLGRPQPPRESARLVEMLARAMS
jgi:serine/threonine protein kinase